MKLPHRIAVLYNIPGVPSSGLKTPRQYEKLAGTRDCSCGRTISANKIRCAQCQFALEATLEEINRTALDPFFPLVERDAKL